MEKPVFILGVGRTGSKIYMSILDKYTNINISPELHIKTLWHRDFSDNMKKIGSLSKNHDINKLIKLMYSGKLFRSFWQGLHVGYVKLD